MDRVVSAYQELRGANPDRWSAGQGHHSRIANLSGLWWDFFERHPSLDAGSHACCQLALVDGVLTGAGAAALIDRLDEAPIFEDP
jgi:hypothetical protein